MNKLKKKLKNSACVGFRSNKEDCNTSNFSEFQTVDSGIVSDQSSRQENQKLNQESCQALSNIHSYKPIYLNNFEKYEPSVCVTRNLSSITENCISNSSQNRNKTNLNMVDCGPVHPYMNASPFYKYQYSDAYNSVASSSTEDSLSVLSELFIPANKVSRRRVPNNGLVSKAAANRLSCTPTNVGPRWDRLPSQVLIQIFKYLSIHDIGQSSQVCKNWYFIAWQPALWDIVDFCHYAREHKDANINRTIHNVFSLLGGLKNPMCPLVCTINLDKCYTVTDDSLILISNSCLNLKTLSVKKCYLISNIAIFHILSKCRLLLKLNVEGCKLISSINTLPDSTDDGVFCLNELNLSYCPLIDDASLSILTYKFRALNKLLIRSCKRVSTIGIEYIARYCYQMHELSLNNLPMITDQAIISISLKINANLKYLSLANCPAISDRSLTHLSDNCHHLRYLNLHKCRLITDSGVMSIAISIQSSIVSLSLSFCDKITNKSLSVISRYCSNIEQLDLNHCVNIDDYGLEEACKHFHQLSMININNTSATRRSFEMILHKFRRCSVNHNTVTDC